MARVLLALLLLSGCGADGANGGPVGEVGRGPGGSETVVALRPLDGSGTRGTVTLDSNGRGGSEVRLSLEDLPDPEGVYVGAVYRGSCPGGADDHGNLPRGHADYRLLHDSHGKSADGENVVQTLTSVASSPNGAGSSVTPLPVPAEELLSGAPKYVDVHGEGALLACADLPVANA